MIKLDKNLEEVPESLIPAFEDLFPANIPRKSLTTHGRRMAVIAAGNYIDDDNHNSRYKVEDIKSALNNIYHGKCGYCEQQIEQSQVEHYRPKTSYYWLAFSWDNLILACPRCNQGKGINFQLRGVRANFVNNEGNIRVINNMSQNYDIVEQPLMINPEVTNPIGMISFTRDGLINSEDERFAYTIEKCAIDRAHLNDQRRTILDDFIRDIQSTLVECKDSIQQQHEIAAIVKKFIRDAQSVKTSYIAFRKFAISERWLNTIIKELN